MWTASRPRASRQAESSGRAVARPPRPGALRGSTADAGGLAALRGWLRVARREDPPAQAEASSATRSGRARRSAAAPTLHDQQATVEITGSDGLGWLTVAQPFGPLVPSTSSCSVASRRRARCARRTSHGPRLVARPRSRASRRSSDARLDGDNRRVQRPPSRLPPSARGRWRDLRAPREPLRVADARTICVALPALQS